MQAEGTLAGARILARRGSATCASLALWSLLAASVLAADSNITLTQSSLVATFRQQEVSVDGRFKVFSGTIDYDATRPSQTRATLIVDMNSLDTGDPDSDAEVLKPAWFDSRRFPQGRFQSTEITPGVAGHFEARGTLTIKGRTQTVSVAVTVQPVGRDNAFDGGFELSRRDFGIGDSSWGQVLDDKVRVRFHLVAAGG